MYPKYFYIEILCNFEYRFDFNKIIILFILHLFLLYIYKQFQVNLNIPGEYLYPRTAVADYQFIFG